MRKRKRERDGRWRIVEANGGCGVLEELLCLPSNQNRGSNGPLFFFILWFLSQQFGGLHGPLMTLSPPPPLNLFLSFLLPLSLLCRFIILNAWTMRSTTGMAQNALNQAFRMFLHSLGLALVCAISTWYNLSRITELCQSAGLARTKPNRHQTSTVWLKKIIRPLYKYIKKLEPVPNQPELRRTGRFGTSLV